MGAQDTHWKGTVRPNHEVGREILHTGVTPLTLPQATFTVVRSPSARSSTQQLTCSGRSCTYCLPCPIPIPFVLPVLAPTRKLCGASPRVGCLRFRPARD